MATVDINGTLVDFPDTMGPDELQSAVSQAATQLGGTKKRKSLPGFAQNAMTDYGANVQGQAELGAYAFPPLAAMKAAQGTNIYDPQRLQMLGKGMAQGVKEIPGATLEMIKHPIESGYARPLSTAMNLAPFAEGAVGLASLAKSGVKSMAPKVLPAAFKVQAGIPEMATEMALAKPSILERAPVSNAQLNEAVGGPIIEAFQEAKKNIGKSVGKVFKKYAGMEGPMQEIVDTPIAQKLVKKETPIAVAQELKRIDSKDIGTGMTKTKYVPGEEIMGKKVSYGPGRLTTIPKQGHSYNDLLINKNLAEQAFAQGDNQALGKLFKRYVSPNADVNLVKIGNKEKLQIITRLKRETQAQAQFNKAPITLKPIDTAKDAAFKKISSDLDELRGEVPGGKRLAVADDAWHEINDIYDTVQRDLSDPGKAKDTMMRLMRGDHTWLTSGRMKGKVDAIRRVEQRTGKKLLEPALEELTRQVFKDWSGKGFTAQILKGASLAGAGAGVVANPALLPVAGAALAASSPRVLRGAIKAGESVGSGINKAAGVAGQLARGSAVGVPLANAGLGAEAEISKPLTKEKAYEFMKKATQDNPKATDKQIRKKARRMAKNAGYTWEGDF